jgi:hypothetical protein
MHRIGAISMQNRAVGADVVRDLPGGLINRACKALLQ